MYTNDKIKRLISERDKLDIEIEHEVEKEKAKYKFNWKRFALLLGMCISPIIAYKSNKKIFSKTSIWSWSYIK